jgi:hypothetical protein
MLIALSILAAFRSGILSSAIFLTSSLDIFATFSVLGFPEALSSLHAFFSSTEAGGVFVINEKDLSA